MKVTRQVVNFKKGTIVSMEVISPKNAIYYLYPIKHIFPKEDVKFLAYFPDDWFQDVQDFNSVLQSDDISEYKSIKSVYALGLFQGFLLDDIYILPLKESKNRFDQSFIDSCKVSGIQLSLNFLSNDKQRVRCFEKDSVFVSLLLMAVQYMKKVQPVSIVKSEKDTIDVYNKIIDKFMNNETITPFDFVFIFPGKTNPVIFAKDNEMKEKLEYFQNIDITETFIPQFQKDFPLETEINRLKIGINKKVWELNRPLSIRAYGTNKNFQVVDLDGVILMLRRFFNKNDVEKYFYELNNGKSIYIITILDSLLSDSKLIKTFNIVLFKENNFFAVRKLNDMVEFVTLQEKFND